MRLSSLIKLAWKNLWARKLRSTLTVGGVVIGVASILFLVSLGYGLEQLVTRQVTTFQAFSQIEVFSSKGRTAKIPVDAVNEIAKIGHVSRVDSVAQLAGRAQLPAEKSTVEAVIMAVEPTFFSPEGVSARYGNLFEQSDQPEVVVNTSLLHLIGASISNDLIGQSIKIDLIIPQELQGGDASAAKVKEGQNVTISGIVEDDSNPIIYLPIGFATNQGVRDRTTIRVNVDNESVVPAVRKAIENIGYSTAYVGDTVAEISQVFILFRLLLGGIGMITLFVAMMGAFNTMTISLVERIREIGLLKTLGMTNKDIFRLFLTEALSIGIIGGLGGVIIGILLAYGVNTGVALLAEKSQTDMVTIAVVPSQLVASILLGSIVLGCITGLYPAYRANKTRSIDSLRYE